MPELTKFDKVVLAMAVVFLVGAGSYWAGSHASADGWKVETATAATDMADESVTEGSVSSLSPGETININTASQAELERLPGIGEARAAAIITWREENGPFDTPEQLTQVSGIGEKLLAQMIEYVAVED